MSPLRSPLLRQVARLLCLLVLPFLASSVSASGDERPDPPGLSAVRELHRAGRPVDALAKAREVLAAVERDEGPETLAAAEVLDWIVGSHLAARNAASEEARGAARRSLAIRERLLGPDHPHVAESLGNLGNVLRIARDFAGAQHALERSLAIKERVFGSDALSFVSLTTLASVALERGDRAAAQPLLERALATAEKALDPGDPQLAMIMSILGRVLLQRGDVAAARPHLERALAIREARYGPNNFDVASSLADLARLLRADGDLASARRLLERALAVYEAVLGPDHERVGVTLSDLAQTEHMDGNLSRARDLYERALSRYERTVGPDSAEAASVLSSLASTLQVMGDLGGARALLERALAATEKARGAEAPEVAAALHNMGSLLQGLGDLEGARAHYERALSIAEKASGAVSHQVGATLTNLGMTLTDMGDVAAARVALARSLAIAEARGDRPAQAEALNNMARVESSARDVGAARRLLERALKLREDVGGADHPSLATPLANLAVLLYASGELDAALATLRRAVEIRERSFGPDHPSMANDLFNLAFLRSESGDLEGALRDALRSEEVSRTHVRATAATLSQREALQQASVRTQGVQLALSFALASPARDASPVLDSLIRSRAVTLDVLADRVQAASLDPALEPFVRARSEAATRWAQLSVHGEGDEAHRRDLAIARDRFELAERELGRRSATVARRQRDTAVGLADVLAQLGPNDALVSLVRGTCRFRERAPGSSTLEIFGEDEYVAFVTRVGARPQLVSLGAAGSLDGAVSRWRTEVARGRSDEALAHAGVELRRRAWDPLAAAAGDARRIIVVPDGSLHLVPFAALPGDDGRPLLETAPLITYASTERDLVRGARSLASGGLLALGGPSFDGGRDPVSRRAAIESPGASSRFRGTTSSCPSFGTLFFDPLPATAAEARELSRKWRRHAARAGLPSDAMTLTGAMADEATIKREAGRHRALHLATHGYFLGSACVEPAAATRGLGVALVDSRPPARDIAVESPLVRSGLALAGFNRRHDQPVGSEDGILTAEEVASLDLSGVDWIVLSACETGMGDIHLGEGVLGLRRGFELAGARTMVMSLWKVPDLETRELMTTLYEERLERGRDAAECVRQASLEVLRRRRARGLDESPFWWGGFIASGP